MNGSGSKGSLSKKYVTVIWGRYTECKVAEAVVDRRSSGDRSSGDSSGSILVDNQCSSNKGLRY